MTSLSVPAYHRLKKYYVIPSIEEYFYKTQAILIDEIKEKVAKVRKVKVWIQRVNCREKRSIYPETDHSIPVVIVAHGADISFFVLTLEELSTMC